MSVKTPERNMNVEALRIMAMIMIIIGHFIGHTYLLEYMSSNGINYYLVLLLRIICNVATNVYVLMSGYYLCEKTFKVKRFVGLWMQVFFYSFGTYMVLVLIDCVPFAWSDFIKVALPVSGNQYWFARVYLGLYLLAPFLNMFIRTMSKKQHQAALVVGVTLFSLWRSFVPFAVTLNSEGGNSIIWFVILYIFAAYLRNYGIPIKSSGVCVTIAGVFLVFSFMTNIGISYLSTLLGFDGRGASLFTEFTAFPMLFASIFLLGAFLNFPTDVFGKKMRIYNIVMFFSTSTFSVYLIHENKYLKPFLWDMIDVPRFAESIWVIPIIIGVSLLIFGVATFMDKILFMPLQKLLRKLQLVKLQKVIDNYLYSVEK